jgi:hypothetical protein
MILLEYLGVLFITLLLLSHIVLRHYASPQTSCPVYFLSTLSFALAFSSTILLPVDLSITKTVNDDEDNADDFINGTMLPWHILFWSTFVLAWVILPLVREMLLSGEFTAWNRFKDGMRIMIIGHLILLGAVTLFIFWLAMHLHEWNVLPVLITLGNTYGLLIVAVLLGYGLVAIPRGLWREADPQYELRKVYIMATKADDSLSEAVWALQDVEFEIDLSVSRINDLDDGVREDLFYKFCVNELLHRKSETAQLTQELNMRRTNIEQSRDLEEQTNEGFCTRPTLAELVKLHRKLKRAQENLSNAEQKWNAIVQKERKLSGISPENGAETATTTPLSPAAVSVTDAPLLSAESRFKYCNARMQYVWLRYLRPCSFRLYAILTAILSAAILWSEATLSSKYNLSPFALVQQYLADDEADNDGFLFQLAALIPLLYMSICVSRSFFNVSLFGPFKLRGNRQSHGVALVFNAQYLVRLQFSLAYNYLLMLKYDTSDSAFSKFLGQMDVIPLFGSSFPVYAPLLTIFLSLFTVCNLYARLLHILGFDHQDALLVGDRETLDSRVNDGKTLIRQYANGVITNRPVLSFGSNDSQDGKEKSWSNSII